LSASGFFSLALSKPIVTRALKVAFIVGTLLAFINHSDALLSGNIDLERLIKMFLTYLVPYSVSTYSAVKAIQAQDISQSN